MLHLFFLSLVEVLVVSINAPDLPHIYFWKKRGAIALVHSCLPFLVWKNTSYNHFLGFPSVVVMPKTIAGFQVTAWSSENHSQLTLLWSRKRFIVDGFRSLLYHRLGGTLRFSFSRIFLKGVPNLMFTVVSLLEFLGLAKGKSTWPWEQERPAEDLFFIFADLPPMCTPDMSHLWSKEQHICVFPSLHNPFAKDVPLLQQH